jgi:hypothetical protein
MRTRWAVISLTIVSLVIATSGCAEFFAPAARPLTAAEMPGIWTAEEPSGNLSTLEFMEDGTVRIDVPDGLLAAVSLDPAAFDWSKRLRGEGTWSIGEALRGAPQQVNYNLSSPGPGIIGSFSVLGDVGSREIIEHVGLADDDDPFIFRKTS